MIYKKIVFLFFTFLSFQFYGQENDKILFTIDNDEISVSEFLEIYNKNIDVVKDESQKNIKTYLELFSIYNW